MLRFIISVKCYKAALLVAFLSLPLLASAQTDGMSVGTNTTPDEMLDINGAIKIGSDFNNDPVAAPDGGAGTIRWNGTEFQGYTASGWVSLSSTGATYSAGTGLTLTETTFSHTAHTGEVTGATAFTIANDAVSTVINPEHKDRISSSLCDTGMTVV